MEQIRIKNGIEVGVNDNGDSILLDVDNTLFVEKYYSMVDRLQSIADSVPTESDLSDSKQLSIVTEKMREVMDVIDDCIGEGTCEKVFGKGKVPMPFIAVDFFNQINPIIAKHQKSREDFIKKQYAPRKGGKK